MRLQKVVKVTESPTNSQWWLVTFECGHEAWFPSTTKPPIGRYGDCGDCPDDEEVR